MADAGFDSDTPSFFEQQIDFILQSGIVTAMVGMLQAPPGTRPFDRLVNERRVCTDFSGDNVDGRTNIIPAMGLDHLIDAVPGDDAADLFAPQILPAGKINFEGSQGVGGDRSHRLAAISGGAFLVSMIIRKIITRCRRRGVSESGFSCWLFFPLSAIVLVF